MKFYVAQKIETKEYIVLKGLISKKKGENWSQEIYTRFFKKEDYANLNLKETFPFVIDFSSSVNQVK